MKRQIAKYENAAGATLGARLFQSGLQQDARMEEYRSHDVWDNQALAKRSPEGKAIST